MKESSYRRKVLIAIVCLLGASLGVSVARYGKRFWIPGERPLKTSERSQAPADHPDSLQMISTSANGTDSWQMIDGNSLTVVKQMREIPQGCTNIFLSSFVNISRPSSTRQAIIADPGQDFEATDALRGGLPFRRLVFAGIGSKGCFVYFERGGVMYPSSCLTIIDYSEGKTLWIGETRKKVWSLEELRSSIFKRDFRDNAGPAC